MSTLNELRQDMDFMINIGNIVDVFKSAALLQFRAFQSRRRLDVKYVQEIERAFRMLSLKSAESFYFNGNRQMPAAVVVVTSDEGFLGELNTLLINRALDVKRRFPKAELLVLGERGARYLQDMDERFVLFKGISDEIRYNEAQSLGSYIMKNFGRVFGSVHVVHPEFVSLTMQRVQESELLPYRGADDQSVREYRGREFVVEPDSEYVLSLLARLWIDYRLWDIFHMAKLAECAARIMHLEGSTHELGQANERLRRQYFKAVHGLNDKSIREISASKMLIKK
jgi:ATP synthase F1 gamma subunit